jgi:orotidine-5'-phosphate decarboxylase
MNFTDRLIDAIITKQAAVIVQLAPRLDQMPSDILPDRVAETELSPHQAGAVLEEFGSRVVERLAPMVPALIMPITSFERFGQPGMDAFFNVAMLARKRGLLVIGDGRGVNVPIASGITPFGRTSLLRHVWDVDAVATGPVRTWSDLAPFVRVASETGKGVYVPDLFDEDPSPPGWSALRTASSLAKWTLGRYGYSPLGISLTRSRQAQWPEMRESLPNSFLLAPATLDPDQDRNTLVALLDDDGLGALLVASSDLTCSYLRAPWRGRFASSEWVDVIEFVTAQWIAGLSLSMPAALGVLA